MRRLAAALATFAVSATLFAGVTYAQGKRHARIAAKTTRPKPTPRRVPSLEELGLANLPVQHFGGY